MEWLVIDSGRLSAEAVMLKDAELLKQLDPNSLPILHLYEWEKESLTYGYFTKPEDYLELSEVYTSGIQMARRPTGGGIIFHLTDFAFSIIIPECHPGYSTNTLTNYAYVNQMIAKLIRNLTGDGIKPELFSSCQGSCSNFCMSQPTQYDLIVNGRKVGGAAQRKTKNGYLHQGSISLALPPNGILEQILKDKTILDQMDQNSYHLLDDLGAENVEVARQLIRKAFLDEIGRI